MGPDHTRETDAVDSSPPCPSPTTIAYSWTAATIRGLRYAMGWTQAQLADRLGTSQPLVHRWEADKGSPRPKQCAKLAAIAHEAGLTVIPDPPPRHRPTEEKRAQLEIADDILAYAKRRRAEL